MVKNETGSMEKNSWIRTNATAESESRPEENVTLTREEKKIFDAAFAGAIIGAGLTALLFIFL